MKTWIWPISLYQRIRELEAQNAALTEAAKTLVKKNSDLVSQLAAESISSASLASFYATSLSSLFQSDESARKARAAADSIVSWQMAEFQAAYDAYKERIDRDRPRTK